jgi:hypothetical protein
MHCIVRYHPLLTYEYEFAFLSRLEEEYQKEVKKMELFASKHGGANGIIGDKFSLAGMLL